MKRFKKVPHLKIDAFPLVDDHFSGVGHYTLGIVRGIDELAGQGKLTYSLIAPRHIAYRLNKYNLRHHKKIIRNPIPNRVIRGFMKYHIPFPCDLILGPGAYYFPSFLAWPRIFTKAGVVIHDTTYLDVPECVEKNNRRYLARVVPFAIKNSDKVIANSHFTKGQLMKHYKLSSDKVVVAPASIDRRYFYRRSDDEIKKVRLKYDIYSDGYLLSVGNVEPRKNYSRLIEAYTKLPKSITDKYPLVIVGAGGWNNDQILKDIQTAKEKGYKIINPKQFVLDADMPALYSGAKVYIFPSIYEGFGMSVLEAYACGTPVIASNVTALPEAAGEAAIYVDPYDVKLITAAIDNTISKINKDPTFYRPAMEKQLKSLNWRKSAAITVAALTGKDSKDFFNEEDQ